MADERSQLTRKEAADRLRPLLTNEFFSTLNLAARTIGWRVDLAAVHDFIERCADIAGIPHPPPVTEGFEYADEE